MIDRRFLLLSLLIAFSAAILSNKANAQTCYQWQMPSSFNSTTYTGARAWYDQTTGPAQELLAWCQANAGPTGFCNVSCGAEGVTNSFTMEGPYHNTFPTAVWVDIRGTCTLDPSENYVRNVQLNSRTNPAGCPVCPAVGSSRSSIIEGSGSPGDDVCGSDGCAYEITSPLRQVLLAGGFGNVASVASKGQPCASNTATANDTDVEQGDCVDDGTNIACNDPQAPPGQGCGYFNGDYVCTGHVRDNTCVAFASGGVACTAGAADAPSAPGGGPATPTGSVTAGTQTVNYYDQSTVNNSSTTVNTTSGQGGSAVGAPGRDGSSSGSGSSGGSTGGSGNGCPGGNCTGIGGSAGANEEVCTFAECTQTFINRVQASPLVASLASASSSVPSGSCPSVTFSMFGETMNLSESMCTLWGDIAGFLTPMFLLAWAWMGTRIVMSA